LYKSIAVGGIRARSVAIELIRELALFDVARTVALLGSDESHIRHAVLQVVNADKPFYRSSDIGVYQALLERVQSAFPMVGTFAESKTILFGKKQVWVCGCGNKNDRDAQHCGACARDMYGFVSDEINPHQAADLIAKRLAALRNRFAKAVTRPDTKPIQIGETIR
jgi:hypothetical protein